MSSDLAPTTQAAPDLGSLIGGRYRVEEKLGQGGMGAASDTHATLQFSHSESRG